MAVKCDDYPAINRNSTGPRRHSYSSLLIIETPQRQATTSVLRQENESRLQCLLRFGTMPYSVRFDRDHRPARLAHKHNPQPQTNKGPESDSAISTKRWVLFLKMKKMLTGGREKNLNRSVNASPFEGGTSVSPEDVISPRSLMTCLRHVLLKMQQDY